MDCADRAAVNRHVAKSDDWPKSSIVPSPACSRERIEATDSSGQLSHVAAMLPARECFDSAASGPVPDRIRWFVSTTFRPQSEAANSGPGQTKQSAARLPPIAVEAIVAMPLAGRPAQRVVH